MNIKTSKSGIFGDFYVKRQIVCHLYFFPFIYCYCRFFLYCFHFFSIDGVSFLCLFRLNIQRIVFFKLITSLLVLCDERQRFMSVHSIWLGCQSIFGFARIRNSSFTKQKCNSRCCMAHAFSHSFCTASTLHMLLICYCCILWWYWFCFSIFQLIKFFNGNANKRKTKTWKYFYVWRAKKALHA